MRGCAPAIADTCADKTIYDTAAINVKKIIEIDRGIRVRLSRAFSMAFVREWYSVSCVDLYARGED